MPAPDVSRPRPRFVLASGSPRRRSLLAGLDLEFSVRPVDIDETPRDGEDAESYVLRLAIEKAETSGAPGELILAADTIVALDGRLLGKPADAGAAAAMLRELDGRTHTVKTALALREVGSDGVRPRRAVHVESTEVRMTGLDESSIAWYIATGEPLDKAGAYGAQGRGALFVEGIRGNFHSVIGLPLPALPRLFAELGYDLAQWRRERS